MGASDCLDSFGYRFIPGHVLHDRIELHIFARAYRECWIALHGTAPTGRHSLEGLGITVEFAAPEVAAYPG